jgi:hypothetical protein
MEIGENQAQVGLLSKGGKARGHLLFLQFPLVGHSVLETELPAGTWRQAKEKPPTRGARLAAYPRRGAF